jgi:hypothetical protein
MDVGNPPQASGLRRQGGSQDADVQSDAGSAAARARTRTLGVRVRVVTVGREYVTHSQTTTDTCRVTRTAAGWSCQCKGWMYTDVCKHIAAIEHRSEREGWVFGRVAPRPTDPTPTPPAAPVAVAVPVAPVFACATCRDTGCVVVASSLRADITYRKPCPDCQATDAIPTTAFIKRCVA